MNSTITLNQQDLDAAKLISSYNVTYVGSRKDESGWENDKWVITINGVDFEYHTGIGHRLTLPKGKYSLSQSQREQVKQLKECTTLNKVLFTIEDRRVYAVAPTQASVLYCIVSDAYCGENTFDDFCTDFGYDEDSRKALETYLSCQENSKKLSQVFKGESNPHEKLSTLKGILEDY